VSPSPFSLCQWVACVENNDCIVWRIRGCVGQLLRVRVLQVQRYESYEAALSAFGIEAVYPGVETMEAALRECHVFRSRIGDAYEALAASHGVVAITMITPSTSTTGTTAIETT
jgi:ASC-1-like (ASCH) protein